MRRLGKTTLPWVLAWLGLCLAALALVWAVHRLYGTARQEIEAQALRSQVQERDRVLLRMREQVDALRLRIMAGLAVQHVDGLDFSLRSWGEGDQRILATFLWDSRTGFTWLGGTPPPAESAARFVPLWADFRSWRGGHGKENVSRAYGQGNLRLVEMPLQDNSLFSSSDLGYQPENLDLLRRRGGTADPWSGCAASLDGALSPWLFWYQTGPESVIRGCLVDSKVLLDELRGLCGERSLARVDLVSRSSQVQPASSEEFVMLDDLMPGYGLLVARGDLFVSKAADLQLSLLVLGLLLAVFVSGALLVGLRTRREFRDAERKISFVGQVSHELRTPLTSIQMFADMLASPVVTEEKRLRFAERIAAESRRLSALLERLLTFNALEKGSYRTTLERVDCARVIEETLEAQRGLLEAAGLQVVFVSEGPVPPAFADASVLRQALINLLDNATKYAASGVQVTVILRRHDDQLYVDIVDKGPGIPAALRSRVFEPFVQGGTSLVDKSPGVGLGLSLARGLMRQSGGDLTLQPSTEGAHFRISTPVFKE